MCIRITAIAVLGLLLSGSGAALAQNFSTSGQNWSGSWGFGSTSERSLAIQRAQAIRAAEAPTPQSVITYNTTNDNRQNYVDTSGNQDQTLTLDFHIGDAIGQNTNTVGAMNTGHTTIDINGSGNVIDAVNAADSRGCLDGSVANTTYGIDPTTGQIGPGGIDISIGAAVARRTCN
jgi:hypothetical protein